MGIVNSNIFNIDINSLTAEDNSELVGPTNKKIDIENNFKDIAILLSKDSQLERSKLEITQLTKKDAIELDKSNFSQHQYTLLKEKHIALYKDFDTYIFITKSGDVYSVKDEALLTIIMNTPRPRKIVYDYPCESDSTYSMQLLANIIENIKTNSLSELLAAYKLKSDDIYDSLYILLHIFNIYEKLIYRHNLNHYINYEHKIYRIFQSINSNIIIDKNIRNSKLDKYVEEIRNLQDKLQIQTDLINVTKQDILIQLSSNDINNQNIYPSLNPRFLKNLNLTEYSKLVDLYLDYDFLLNIDYSYKDTYKYGIPTPYNSSCIVEDDKIIIHAQYLNLFQNIFAELSKNKDYIQAINEEKNIFLNKLSKKRKITDNLLLLIEYTFEAYMNKCSTVEEYKLYFFNNKLILLSDDDIQLLLNILSNDLKEFIEIIDSFDNLIITSNFISHENLNNFGKMHYSLKRKLIKNLILEINDYLNAFNNQNKSKIYFIGYNNDDIYIQCDNISYENALDTLTRIMVQVYDKCLKRTKSYCYIEKLDRDINI